MTRLALISCFVVALLQGPVAVSKHVGAGSIQGSAPTPAKPPSATGHRRALLVGIHQYNFGREGDWWNLNTIPDVEALSDVLKKKFGFDEVKILTTGPETTHQAIKEAFYRYLIKPTTSEDIVLFHYSGHGSQVPDNQCEADGRCEEVDGLDETLVPSDYTKDGLNDIRDDEIAQWLTDLKKQNPKNATLTFDTCHSGSNTRGGSDGVLNVRGKKFQGLAPGRRTRGETSQESGDGVFTSKDIDRKGYVVLSAASADQVARETTDEHGNAMGLMTYALVKALNSPEAGKMTYRDLYEEVRAAMMSKNPGGNQDPQLEGDLDYELLSRTAKSPDQFIDVDLEDDVLKLQAGELQGMTVGSVFKIFKKGTKTFSGEPLARAKIRELRLTSADLELLPESKNIKLEDLNPSRAIEELHQYGDNRLRVKLPDVTKLTRGTEVEAQIRNLPLADTKATNWDVRVCPDVCGDVVAEDSAAARGGAGPGGVMIQRRDGSIAATVSAADNLPLMVREALIREARWQFLNKLANTDAGSTVKIEMRLVQVELQKDAGGKYKRDARGFPVVARDVKAFAANEAIDLASGDTVMVEIKNTGDSAAYVTVLDLRENGAIAPLYPHPRVPIQENKFEVKRDQAGNDIWQRIPAPFVFALDRSLPERKTEFEVFKAVATGTKADFSALLQEANRRGGGTPPAEAASPIGQLLNAVALGTRAEPVLVDPRNWFTAAVVFKIGGTQ